MSNLSIEEIIRRAMEEGQFDNLPGKGKPLQLDQNPHQDPEWRAAHSMLKSGGFSLPWIESLREIEAHIQEARTSLARSWSWCSAQLAESIISSQADDEWKRAIASFREKITEINREIREYNLQVPSDRFQLRLLNAEREIEQIQNTD
jgi:DnaJ family protein C protein 28